MVNGLGTTAGLLQTHLGNEDSNAKRRKLRKGTHSCWECKRRKMKCIFDADGSVCISCQRRGSVCVSQEFSAEFPASSWKKNGESAASIQPQDLDSSAQTSATPDRYGERSKNGIPASVSITAEPSRHLNFYGYLEQNYSSGSDHVPTSRFKHEMLSQYLYNSLPSQQDTEKICGASGHPSVLTHEIMSMPYNSLDETGLATSDILLEIPKPNSHPALIAKYMLLLATFVQHLLPTLHQEIKGLSESPKAIMNRLVELASDLVTTKNELMGSIEGLECVILESVYQANTGNLRQSWIVCRRAMNIAQLLGLDRSDKFKRAPTQYNILDASTKCDPQLLWFRIIFMDRYLCLMLGLSQGSMDRSMTSSQILENDTPMGRLERTHCLIASQILERNDSNSSFGDLDLTRTLDKELQVAAKALPSKWWLVLDLASATDPQGLFWNTRRLFAQVFHYYLLNQLYLPYMLRSSSPRHTSEYARITCVNASREVLSRFITLRSFNSIAYSCRTVDFLALMAALTLILAHLDSSTLEEDNLLAHQYYSDRAMVEKVKENMEELNRLNSDALSSQGAELLRKLLAIDIDAVDGDTDRGRRTVSVQGGESESTLSDHEDDGAVIIHIPYFGIVRITRHGMKRISRQQFTDPIYPSPAIPTSSASTEAELRRIYMSNRGVYDELTPNPPQSQNGYLDPPLQQVDISGVAAGMDEWSLQGVEWAFFETLTRGFDEDEVNKGSEWANFPDTNIDI